MQTADWTTIIGQLGASGVFMVGLVYVARLFYQHLMDDQKVMRERIAALEARLDKVTDKVNAIRQ